MNPKKIDSSKSKSFILPKSFTGYNCKEADTLIDKLIFRVDELEQENSRYKQELNTYIDTCKSLQAKNIRLTEIIELLTKEKKELQSLRLLRLNEFEQVMSSARQTADQIITDASLRVEELDRSSQDRLTNAERRISEAQAKAQPIVSDAEAQARRITVQAKQELSRVSVLFSQVLKLSDVSKQYMVNLFGQIDRHTAEQLSALDSMQSTLPAYAEITQDSEGHL